MKTGFATSSDGLQINYASSETWDAELLPLIFVPGMLGVVDFYAKELDEFSPRRTVAFSHRGLGQSQVPEEGQASFASRCNDVDAVATALGFKSYALCGFSRGVSICVEHSLRHSDQVKGIILIDCDASYMKPPQAWLDWFKEHGHPQFHFETLKRYVDEAEYVDLTPRLQDLKCPVLIMRGGKAGSLLPEDQAARMSRLANNAPIVVLPNTEHEIAEKDFDLYRSSILNFLKRI